MSASFTVSSTDDVAVAVHDFGGSGPALLMCHATGMHGMVWQPVARHLTDSYRCLALDFRGHGDSTLPGSGSLGWDGMAADVLAVVDGLNLEPPRRAVGWSMGGCALIRAGVERPGLWQSAWAMEPIIFTADGLGGSSADRQNTWRARLRRWVWTRRWAGSRGNHLAESARRRREVFASRDDAFDHYAAKPPFQRATPDSLRAYVDHGFEDLPEGGVQLKCRGETEARVFENSVTDTAEQLHQFIPPLTVVASGDGFPPALVAPRVADEVKSGTLERMDDLTHFAPMEDPVRVAASIRASVA